MSSAQQGNATFSIGDVNDIARQTQSALLLQTCGAWHCIDKTTNQTVVASSSNEQLVGL